MSDESPLNQLAERLREEARGVAYPPTPDSAAGERARLATAPRRLGWRVLRIALVAALLLVALLAVPQVRAAALRALQIGVVRVVVEPTPPTVPALPSALAPSPVPAPDLGLVGATTLQEATALVEFPVRLPSYPPDLGPPDLVYLQNLDGAALVLVWLDPSDRSRPRLSLHALSSEVFVRKTLLGDETRVLSETVVGGAQALWVRGPHLVETGRPGSQELELRRIVAGDTLIWTDGELTYRLETDMSLEQAVRIAESLR